MAGAASTPPLGLLFLCLSVLTPVSRAQVESPYAAWSLGPPADPDFFPIGVWLQNPSLAGRYAKLGVNLYVGLWEGPTAAQLDELREVGMRTICAPTPVGWKLREDPLIVGWMQADEPDNRKKNGLGPVRTVEEILSSYERLKARDPDRPVFLNLGQGVANDDWVGRAAKRRDYLRYVRGGDIVSFDVYPVTNIRRSDGEDYLWYVARGVERLRRWTQDERVVWNFIETTGIGSDEKRPTPAQVRAEVWMALIHGSRGIVYFCHEFQPKVNSAAIFLVPEMVSAVRGINAEIQRFAPLLNAPSNLSGMVVESTPSEVPVAALRKDAGETVHVFAVGMRNAPAEAVFRLADVEGFSTVRVIGEKRTLSLREGVFADSFEPYAVHLYALDP